MQTLNNFFKNLIDNMPGVFKSKRFWVAFASIVTMIAVALRPDLSTNSAQIEAGIVAMALFLIHGYSMQDKASAEQGFNKYLGTTPVSIPKGLEKAVEQDLNATQPIHDEA